MAENKTKSTDASVGDYLDGIADAQRRREAKRLAQLLAKATGEKPKMWGASIVGFGSYHYQYESGREGDSCLIGFASRKGNISIYGLGHSPKVEAVLEKMGKHKRGKGCLYLKSLEDIDEDLFAQAVALSLAEKQREYP